MAESRQGRQKRAASKASVYPILIEEAGKLLKVVLAGGRVGHSHRPRILPDLPAQINQRRNYASCAEQFRQHPDISPGHDSLKLSRADLPVNQFWMRRQFSSALDRMVRALRPRRECR